MPAVAAKGSGDCTDGDVLPTSGSVLVGERGFPFIISIRSVVGISLSSSSPVFFRFIVSAFLGGRGTEEEEEDGEEEEDDDDDDDDDDESDKASSSALFLCACLCLLWCFFCRDGIISSLMMSPFSMMFISSESSSLREMDVL